MRDLDLNRARALLFDLGNVIIDIDFERSFAHWASSSGDDAGRLRNAFAFDDTYERFERGEINQTQYFAYLQSTLGITLSEEQWLSGWNALLIDEKPEMRPLLAKARAHYPIYLFTNTNSAHQARWSQIAAGSLDLFAAAFVSSELGLRKPESEAYAAVCERMGVAPEEVIFFDDSPVNIAGAREFGIQAVHTLSSTTVAATLDALVASRIPSGV